MSTERVMRVVEALEGGLYREKRITVQHEVDDKGAAVKELSRSSEYGGVFRKVRDGEEPTVRILDEATYDVLPLVAAEEVPEVLPPPINPVPDRLPTEVVVPPVQAQPAAESTAKVVAKKAKPKATKKVTKPKAKTAAKKTPAKAKKQPVKKPAKAKKVARPSSGQSGPPIDDLTFEKLNKKERKVAEALSDIDKSMKIDEIGAKCFPSETKFKQRSWTRNSLRRLVRGFLVERIGEGDYKATGLGKRRVSAAAA